MFQEIDLALLHFFNGSQSAIYDQFILTLTNGLTWIPLYIALFVMVLKNNESMSQIFIIVGCCALGVILSASIDNMLVKPFVGRLRPTQDLLVKYTIDTAFGYRENNFSFFSAHAANTFTLALFMIFLVRNRAFTIAMAVWSLVICYTRLYLGVHYPGDITVGLLWGGFVGTLVWDLYTQIEKQNEHPANFISSQYTKTGYQHEHIHVAVSVLAFTLVYAIIKACFSLYI